MLNRLDDVDAKYRLDYWLSCVILGAIAWLESSAINYTHLFSIVCDV